MATMTLKVVTKITDAAGIVGAQIQGSEDYTGGDFVISQVEVADSTTDQLLSFGELTTAGLLRAYLETDQDITYKIVSSGGTALFLPAGCGAALYFSAAEDYISVSNASGSAAVVTLYGIGAA